MRDNASLSTVPEEERKSWNNFFEPIELDDAELEAVAGGQVSNSVGIGVGFANVAVATGSNSAAVALQGLGIGNIG